MKIFIVVRKEDSRIFGAFPSYHEAKMGMLDFRFDQEKRFGIKVDTNSFFLIETELGAPLKAL